MSQYVNYFSRNIVLGKNLMDEPMDTAEDSS